MFVNGKKEDSRALKVIIEGPKLKVSQHTKFTNLNLLSGPDWKAPKIVVKINNYLIIVVHKISKTSRRKI